MKIQWSGIGITEGRGKVGGNVASRNGSGAYIRKNTAPVQPNSPAQQAVKAIFALIVNAWKFLTDAQRTGWSDASPSFPQTDSLGVVTFLSGFQLYTKLNNSLKQFGEAIINDAPVPGLIFTPSSLALLFQQAVGTMDVTIGEVVPAGQAMGIWVTAPLSAGVKNVTNRLVLLKVEAAAAGPVIDIAPEYIAMFGALPAVGSRIGVQVQDLNMLTGQRGVKLIETTIMVA